MGAHGPECGTFRRNVFAPLQIVAGTYKKDICIQNHHFLQVDKYGDNDNTCSLCVLCTGYMWKPEARKYTGRTWWDEMRGGRFPWIKNQTKNTKEINAAPNKGSFPCKDTSISFFLSFFLSLSLSLSPSLSLSLSLALGNTNCCLRQATNHKLPTHGADKRKTFCSFSF